MEDTPKPNRILAIDPGFTTGYVIADWELTIPQVAPKVIETMNVSLPMNVGRSAFEWDKAANVVAQLVDKEPDIIVIEDYRIYKSKADMHIGSRLLVSELIGAICQEAAVSQIPVVRLMAGVKGNWPIARLKARYPQYKFVPSPHSRDALLLALYYIEKTLGWKPTR